MEDKELRLNKFLAERLGLSRRQADDAISNGKVTVDGKVAIFAKNGNFYKVKLGNEKRSAEVKIEY